MTDIFTDVMVDIETTGVQPDRNGIIQIAAVKFNYETGAICHDFFEVCLEVPHTRFWSESTRNWWAKQRQDVLHKILSNALPAEVAIKAFATWCYPQASLRFWSKPSHFDYMFLSSYFADFDVPNPFSYREATDMNSFLRGLFSPEPKPDERSFGPVEGAAHNALDDVLHQIKILLKCKELAKQQLIIPANVDNLKLIEA